MILSKRWLLSVCLLAGCAAGAALRLSSTVAGESTFFDPELLRPGMTGVGRTVFQGVTPEDFEVEILGVLKNGIGPQQDMIISRLHGKNVERTGVIAGMSGSPVILDGKILGAVSYRLGTFEKEAIAGITPIADMLKAADMPRSPNPALAASLLKEWESPGTVDAAARSVPIPGMAGSLVPISTPLVFAGYPESLIRDVTPLFQSRGLEPVAGGGGGQGTGADYPITPGVAISVPLVRGDLSIAATGTLTHVQGNRVWAFGHPFLGTGPVRYPMARAEVIVTYPSLLGSFKIANSTSVMGTLLQDRLTSIEGELGAAPEMLPVSVSVEGPAGNRRFSFEVVQDDALTPILVGISVQASLQRILEYSAETTLRAEIRVESDKHPTLSYSMLESDAGGVQSAAAGSVAREVATLLNVIYGNRFHELRVRSADVKVFSLPEARLARVSEISLSPSQVRPGEDLTVRAAVQPYRGEAFLKEFKVRIPPDTPKGPLNVLVSSATNLNGLEGGVLQQRFNGAPGVDELIRFVNSLRRDDGLYLQVTRRGLGAVVQGEPLPALPLSVVFTLGSSRFSGEEYPAPELPVLEVVEKTDFVLTGGRRTAIQVR
jgi:SpoIVB peptidase S55